MMCSPRFDPKQAEYNGRAEQQRYERRHVRLCRRASADIKSWFWFILKEHVPCGDGAPSFRLTSALRTDVFVTNQINSAGRKNFSQMIKASYKIRDEHMRSTNHADR